MPYDLFLHRHNFAVWAAARAAQRGFTGTRNLEKALEGAGIQRFLADPESFEINCDRFEEMHRRWCAAIVSYLESRAIRNVTYGRAAKLLAVYLKSMVIVGGYADSPIAQWVHPPVDRRLLKNLARDPRFNNEKRRVWSQTNWTQINSDEYYKIIDLMRTALPENSPFWVLEEYWTASE